MLFLVICMCRLLGVGIGPWPTSLGGNGIAPCFARRSTCPRIQAVLASSTRATWQTAHGEQNRGGCGPTVNGMGTGLARGGLRVLGPRHGADRQRRRDSCPKPGAFLRGAGCACRVQLRAGWDGDVCKHALLAGPFRVQPDRGVETGRPAHDRDAARRLHDQVQPARVRRAGGGDQFPDIRGFVPWKQRPLHRSFRTAGAGNPCFPAGHVWAERWPTATTGGKL